MKIEYLFIVLFAILSFGLHSQNVPLKLQQKWDKESSTPEITLLNHKPSRLPDRVFITPLESDNRSLAFTWRTDTSVANAQIEIMQGDSLSFSNEDIMQIDASHKKIVYKDYPMHYHTAEVSHLKPDKIYRYRVGHSPYWSSWYTFSQQNFNDTINFLYFGDTQNGIFDQSKRIYKEAIKKFGNSKFALHAGDLINHANNDYEWAEWHAATEDINTSMPVIATPGNHEYLKNLEGSKVQLSAYWTTVFPFPYEWEAGQYFFDYGFVRFIVLNSNEKISEQAVWMDSLLTTTNQEWVVILSHHPVFSGAKGRVNKGLQENWLPVIEKHKHKIGLVLQGHDHTYARGGLLNRTGTKERPVHPVFTVSVVGRKYYQLEKQSWMDTGYNNVSSYQYIQITRDKIAYKAYSQTNTLIDEFQISK